MRRESWVVVASCICGTVLVQVVGSLLREPVLPDEAASEVRLEVARLGRRVDELATQVDFLLESRHPPAVVTRIEEQRGIEQDEAWNAYFDSLEHQIEELAKRVDATRPGG